MNNNKFIPDAWQRKVLNCKGNILLRTGRQVGKSEVIAEKVKILNKKYNNITILIIASAERQSSLLFEKIKAKFMIDENQKIEKVMIGKEFKTLKKKRVFEKEFSYFKEEPTLNRMRFKNGNTIICVPTGRTGAFIRGFTIDYLIADEAGRIYPEVYNAVLPMLATSKRMRGTGFIILAGTPWKKEGYFWDAENDKDFIHVHVNSENCPRIDKGFLRKEKKRLSKRNYTLEYKGEYMEEENSYFPKKLIKKCSNFYRYVYSSEYDLRKFDYYLGVDLARYGRDDTVLYVVEVNKVLRTLRGIYIRNSRKKALTSTIGAIVKLNQQFKFKRMYIDEGGLGAGVVDVLIEKFKKRIVGIDNSKKSISQKRERKTIKEDLYNNLLVLMEQGKATFIKDKRANFSLQNIKYDFKSNGDLMLHGYQDHIAEAMVRGFWAKNDMKKRLMIF